jgi:hypothetical protein
MAKRIMVTLDEDQYKIFQGIKGLGTKDPEKVRNIIIAYLSEKGYIKKASEGHQSQEKHIPENEPFYTS